LNSVGVVKLIIIVTEVVILGMIDHPLKTEARGDSATLQRLLYGWPNNPISLEEMVRSIPALNCTLIFNIKKYKERKKSVAVC
jgi:hypothetical protein